jgi:ferric-dicitrate binding protein FerR (iron transport regulator)
VEPTINDIDELLGKYLAKETSSVENSRVEKWLRQSDANQNYFDQLKVIFESAARVNDIPTFDTDQAWNSLQNKLKQNRGGKVVPLSTANSGSLYWRVAAALLLVSAFAYFTYKLLEPTTTTFKAQALKSVETDTLPDGSEVSLNKKTELAYTFDKKSKAHRVKLKGEAFFKIQHEEKKDFVVDAEGVFIKDIGTSFNVKAYPESNTIEVDVQEGEVKFYSESTDGLLLHAGEKGIYNKISKTFSSDSIEPNIAAYKTKYFVYSNKDLGAVIDELNSIYDKKIVIADNLRKCRLTVTFNNETIEEIANVIAETLGMTLIVSGDKLQLEGSGCE